jgi:Ca2+-binding RTX toxin-like protein
MSILDKLKKANPDIFQGSFGGAIQQGVFSDSTNYPKQTKSTIVSEVARTDGIQVLVGGAGNDTVIVGSRAGDAIAFGGDGVDKVRLPDVNFHDGWMMGTWSSRDKATDAMEDGALDHSEPGSGYIFYNPETDQTIAVASGFSVYELDGARFNLGPSVRQVDQLKEAEQWLGAMTLSELKDEGFLSRGTTTKEVDAVMDFFSDSPQLMLAADGKNVTGTAQGDVLNGGARDDALRGLGGADRLNGRAGDDALEGGGGRDVLLGAAGKDVLNGGGGGDVLDGGRGDDAMRGQAGADRFVFSTRSGDDVILDFGGKDIVDLSGHNAVSNFGQLKAVATETAKGVVFELGADTLLLKDVALDDLSRGDFIF